MSINRITATAILVLVIFITNVHAQTPTVSQPGPVSSVTGSLTSAGTLRMIAHGEALQIRMEIYSAAGELVSDSGLRQGNIVDWKQTDATQAMADGSYLVVVTVKDFKGNLNQRTAALSLQAGQLQLLPQKRDEVNAVQTQAIETRLQGKKVRANDGDDVQAGLLTNEELSQTVSEMRRLAEDETVLAIMPLMSQVWGSKPFLA